MILKWQKLNPEGKKKFSDYKIEKIVDYCIDNLMDIRDIERYRNGVYELLKKQEKYQEFLETMAFVQLIVNRKRTWPKVICQYAPRINTDMESESYYIKIKSSILGIRYTYNENGKLLISGPRKAPGKYSKIKKEKFSWKICSDVLQ